MNPFARVVIILLVVFNIYTFIELQMINSRVRDSNVFAYKAYERSWELSSEINHLKK